MKFRILAIGLFFCFLSAPYWAETERSEEATIFRVKVVGDQFISVQRKWQETMKDLMKSVNNNFKEQGVLIRFEVAEIATWKIKEEVIELREALALLREEVPLFDCDLVIGITDRFYETDKESSGYYGNPGYIIIKNCPYPFSYEEKNEMIIIVEKSWNVVMIMHEIGHFFGLPHSSNPGSIMHDKRVFSVRQDLFSKEEIEHINKTAPIVKKEKMGTFSINKICPALAGRIFN